MAIHQTHRETVNISCFEAMRLIAAGLNASEGTAPPTVDFEGGAVVLCSENPITLDCRGVTWQGERRISSDESRLEYFAAVELPPGRVASEASAELERRYGGKALAGPVAVPRSSAVFSPHLPFVALATPAPKASPSRTQLFRADLLRQLAKLEGACASIEADNRELAEDVAKARAELRKAEAIYSDDPTSRNGNAVTKCESDVRLALLRQKAKTLSVPAEKRSSVERLRAVLARLDGSKPCFLTGQDAGGMPDGGTLESLDELAARLASAPAPGWSWRSRRPGPVGGDASPSTPWGRPPAPHDGDGGHCCFSYDVAGVDDLRDLFGLLPGRCLAHRLDDGWRVIVELSRPCTDDELPAVVASLDLGTDSYATAGWFPPAGTPLINLDNVPPVDVDATLAGVMPQASGAA